MPVLLVGAAQSIVSFRREADERRVNLTAAAERSVTVVRIRMQSAEVLLETLSPEAIGLQCSPRLAEAMQRSRGFANLIHLDAYGRVSCAAGSVGPDPGGRCHRGSRSDGSDWYSSSAAPDSPQWAKKTSRRVTGRPHRPP